MVSKDILSWYEANLPAGERKVRGHFSTPPLLVEQMLDACGYRPENDLSRIRVLDPACGSGNFLVSATRRLMTFGKYAGYTTEAIIASIRRNVWGFDPDPIACFLADMQLRLLLSEEFSREVSSHVNPSFHVHQADGLVFPWEQSGDVDLFLANPPYLATKNNDLSGYRWARCRGQSDSYLLFLDLALQVVRPNGWICLVLPDPVLARANATKERQRLLKETTVHHIWHLSGVFTAYVGAVVIIAQKCSPPHIHQVNWAREKWVRDGRGKYGKLRSASDEKRPVSPINNSLALSTRQVAQSLLFHQPGAELRYLLSERQGMLIDRLRVYRCEAPSARKSYGLMPLGELMSIRRGEELGKESPHLTQVCCEDEQEWYPVLRGGGDVRPYGVPVGQCWIARTSIAKPLECYLAPKLLVVKSMGHLQAALDLQGHVVLQTLYLLGLRRKDQASQQEDELYFLLALLNSRLLREYVYVLHTAYKWVQPQIEQHVLVHLPIPIVDASEKRQISERTKLLMDICSKISSVVELKAQYKEVYEEQERAICVLYDAALR